jgi:hypothetical protein
VACVILSLPGDRELTHRFAERQGRGDAHIERSHRGPDRNADARIGVIMHILRHASRFASHHDDVIGTEDKIPQRNLGLGRQQHQPFAVGAAPLRKGAPGNVPFDRDMIEIVHARAPEVAIGDRESGRLDDRRRHAQTCTGAQHRASILGDVGLVKRETERSRRSNHRSRL